MGTVLNSYDKAYTSLQANGGISRIFTDQLAAGTAALTTCGYESAQRFPTQWTVPSIGAGLTGIYVTNFESIITSASSLVMAGIETTLGTLTVNGNSFAAGSTMPTKPDPGTPSSNIQTASLLTAIVATTALTATTPTVTITYTNEGGTGSRTATLVLPTNPVVNSAFLINPHLQSGDCGIQAITNISISTGTAGVLTAFGLLPIGWSHTATTALSYSLGPLQKSDEMWKLQAGDIISFWRLLSVSAASDLYAIISGVADN